MPVLCRNVLDRHVLVCQQQLLCCSWAILWAFPVYTFLRHISSGKCSRGVREPFPWLARTPSWLSPYSNRLDRLLVWKSVVSDFFSFQPADSRDISSIHIQDRSYFILTTRHTMQNSQVSHVCVVIIHKQQQWYITDNHFLAASSHRF